MIAILVYFHLVHCSFIFGHGWLHSSQFCKTCQIGFVRVGVVCAAWWHLRELSQQATINASALVCVLWQNFDEDSFDMLYKNDCWAAIPDPIWTTNVPFERNINMLSSTDKNFMICLFNVERFSIESRFPFFFNSHCILMTWMGLQ